VSLVAKTLCSARDAPLWGILPITQGLFSDSQTRTDAASRLLTMLLRSIALGRRIEWDSAFMPLYGFKLWT
jgi:hypothetical protein